MVVSRVVLEQWNPQPISLVSTAYPPQTHLIGQSHVLMGTEEVRRGS